MGKRLLCYLGFHRCRRKRSSDGGFYRECSRCGRFRDAPQHVIGPM